MSKMMKHIKFDRVFLFLLYLFLFFLVLRNSFNYLDPDFGWHLKVGQQIAQEHKLPEANTFNFSFTGNWVDHEWFINYLVYLIWYNFGYITLSIIFSVLIVFTLYLMPGSAHHAESDRSLFLLAVLEIFGLIASLPHFGVRMQEVGLLFLILLLLIINKYNEKKEWHILLFLPPLFYGWAFLHASFLIGFFILGLWILVKIIELVVRKYYPKPYFNFQNIINIRQMIIFISMSSLSLAVTALTPYGLKLFNFLNGYKDTYYQSHIQEWLSQFNFPFNYWQLGYLALVALALFFYVYYSIGKEKHFKIDFWKLFLVGSFFVLSFKSRRHFPLLFVSSFAFLMEIYGIFFRKQAKEKIDLISQGVNICVACCLVLLSILLIVKTDYVQNPFSEYCSDYPCGAADFLHNHPQYRDANLFNEYSWGGFLIWQLSERKLFIDGRLPQVAFAGHTFLEEYYEFYQTGLVAKKLEQYHIRLVLIRAKDADLKASTWEKIFFGIKDKELKTINNLRVYLAASPDWQTIYHDQTSVIYYKKPYAD